MILPETPLVIEEAKYAIGEGEKLINDRQKLTRIVDRNEHGWATVEEYEDDELADNSDVEKKLFKAEARAGRKLHQKLGKGGKGKFSESLWVGEIRDSQILLALANWVCSLWGWIHQDIQPQCKWCYPTEF